MEKQLFWLEFIPLKNTYYNNASINCGSLLADYCFDLSLFSVPEIHIILTSNSKICAAPAKDAV
jgi:hypothetical protein